jgi:hypothetical protein
MIWEFQEAALLVAGLVVAGLDGVIFGIHCNGKRFAGCDLELVLRRSSEEVRQCVVR